MVMNDPSVLTKVADLEKRLGELSAKATENALKTAELAGSLHSFEQILAAAALIVGLIAAGGIYQHIQDQSELVAAANNAQAALKSANKIATDYAVLEQSSLVDSIEDVFNVQDSLDALRDKPEVVARLEELNNKLLFQSEGTTAAEGSTYVFIVQALQPFLIGDYKTALQLLEKVDGKDKEHYIYHYLSAVCLVRSGRLNEAAAEFNAAGRLTEGHRRIQVMNGEGGAELEGAVAAHDRQGMLAAAKIFAECIGEDSSFAPAYFNLAASYARLGLPNDAVTCYLVFPTYNSRMQMPLESTVKRIQEDLGEPTERNLEAYVRDYLRIQDNIRGAAWESEVRNELYAKWKGISKRCPVDFEPKKEMSAAVH
jgi:tetratricopeptide (TPR) repeat protein